jgi:hypothetical protein
MPAAKNDLESSLSAMDRARELIKRSRELIAEGKKRRI